MELDGTQPLECLLIFKVWSNLYELHVIQNKCGSLSIRCEDNALVEARDTSHGLLRQQFE